MGNTVRRSETLVPIPDARQTSDIERANPTSRFMSTRPGSLLRLIGEDAEFFDQGGGQQRGVAVLSDGVNERTPGIRARLGFEGARGAHRIKNSRGLFDAVLTAPEKDRRSEVIGGPDCIDGAAGQLPRKASAVPDARGRPD